MTFKHRVSAGISLAAMASAPAFAQADQTASTPVPVTASGRASPEEQGVRTADPADIIVTARRRDESLMQTPVAIAAVSQDQIQNLNINTVTALDSIVPSLRLNTAISISGAVVYMRGIGVVPSGIFLDQSVGINIDGFASARGQLFRQGLFDAGQIEILKGPQSLFFGKSTSGGVIAIRTANPTPEWQASLSAGYEFTADEATVDGYISGPITEGLGIRLAGFWRDTQGWFVNPNPTVAESRVPNESDYGGRLTLAYESPDGAFNAKLKVSHSRSAGDYHQTSTGQKVCPGPTNPNALEPYDNCRVDKYLAGFPDALPYSATADFRTGGPGYNTNTPHPFFRDGKPYTFSRASLAVLDLNYEFANGGLSLNSLTGWDRVKSGDGGRTTTAAGFNDIADRSTVEEFSQEVRLTSKWDGWFNFMLGGLYNWDKRDVFLFISFDNRALVASRRGTYVGGREVMKSTAWSGFAQFLLTPIDRWELSLGARYSWTEKRVTSLVTQNQTTGISGERIGVNVPLSLTRYKEDEITPEVTLTYRPTDDLTTFISWKRGYKGPGWNGWMTGPPASNPPVPGETTEGFEGGIKTMLFDRQLSVDLVGFYYDYKDLQVVFNDPLLTAAIIANGADSRIKGFELSTRYRPHSLEGLTLSASLDFNDGRYTRFSGANCYGLQTAAQGCITAGGRSTQNLTGKRMILAPKWAGSLGIAYEWPVRDDWRMSFNGQARYTSSYIAAPEQNPFSRQKGFLQADVAVHLFQEDKRWDLALICRNCSNEIYITNASDAGLGSANVFVSRPRQFQIQATVRM